MGRTYAHLSAEERERIAISLAQGCSLCQMVRLLLRNTSCQKHDLARGAQPLCRE